MSGFDVMFQDRRDWVNFGDTYVTSEAFKVLFREGMTLVEEAAAYLDGTGREESRLMSRDGTLSYASESMRLTTPETFRAEVFGQLPATLQDLIVRSRRLHTRILHLDGAITEERPVQMPQESPVVAQLGRLQAAFAPASA